jgi:hypothetical protein
MDLSSLRDLLSLLREHEVRLYRSGDLELHLGPAPSRADEGDRDRSIDRLAAEEEDRRITFAHVEGWREPTPRGGP